MGDERRLGEDDGENENDGARRKLVGVQVEAEVGRGSTHAASSCRPWGFLAGFEGTWPCAQFGVSTRYPQFLPSSEWEWALLVWNCWMHM